MIHWLGNLILSNNRILITLLLALLFWFASRGAAHVINQQVADGDRRYTLRKATSILLFILFVVFVIPIWLRQLQGVSTIIGLVGAGIAFSLQEVIASLAGWMLITWNRSYRVGDRIELGGIQGDVIDVGLIRTTLMETGNWIGADQQTGRLVTISNAYALRQPVFNYSAHFPYLWDGFKIPITYDSDWKLALRIIEEELARFQEGIEQEATSALQAMQRFYYLPNADSRPGVYVRFTDNWIEFSVRYLVLIRERRLAGSKLSKAILERLCGEKSVTIASTTLSIVHFPGLEG